MKKIRPPLEDVLDSKFFEKIRPRLEGVLFWGEGGAHFFDGGGAVYIFWRSCSRPTLLGVVDSEFF